MTEKEILEQKLEQEIAEGKITVDEAENEWQDFMHRGEDCYQSVYGW